MSIHTQISQKQLTAHSELCPASPGGFEEWVGWESLLDNENAWHSGDTVSFSVLCVPVMGFGEGTWIQLD